VLADQRRRAVDAAGCALGEPEPGPDQREFTVRRLDMLQHVAMFELWVMDDFGDRPDRGAGHVGFGQPLLPILGAVGRERFLDNRAQRRLVLRPGRPVGEALIIERIGAADAAHQAGELLLGHHRQHQIPLARLEAVAGDFAGARQISELAVNVAGDGVFGDLPRDEAERRVQHRHIDELPDAGLAALD
jgi:hypothetical protein